MEHSSNGFLLVHRGALGDFLFTWPLISLLRKRFSSSEFHLLSRPAHVELAMKIGLVDSGSNCEAARWLPFFDQGKLPDSHSQFLHGILWIKDKGEWRKNLKKKFRGVLHFHAPFPSSEIPVATHHLTAARVWKIKETNWAIPSWPEKIPARNILLFHPGSGSPSKNFSRQRIMSFANSLPIHLREKLVFLLGPAELESGWVEALGSRYPSLTPQSLVELVRTIVGAKAYIGMDSGPTHLASLLGKPTLGLFIHTNPVIWGLIGSRGENRILNNHSIEISGIQDWMERELDFAPSKNP